MFYCFMKKTVPIVLIFMCGEGTIKIMGCGCNLQLKKTYYISFLSHLPGK